MYVYTIYYVLVMRPVRSYAECLTYYECCNVACIYLILVSTISFVLFWLTLIDQYSDRHLKFPSGHSVGNSVVVVAV